MKPRAKHRMKMEESEQDQAEIERDNERAKKLTEGFKRITKELKDMPF